MWRTGTRGEGGSLAAAGDILSCSLLGPWHVMPQAEPCCPGNSLGCPSRRVCVHSARAEKQGQNDLKVSTGTVKSHLRGPRLVEDLRAGVPKARKSGPRLTV